MWPHAPYCSPYFGGFTYVDGVYYCSTHQQAATASGARAPAAPAAPRPGHEESRRAQRVYEESCRSVEMALDAGEDQMDLDEGEDQPAWQLAQRAQREALEASRLAERCGCASCRSYFPRPLPYIPPQHEQFLRAEREYMECCRKVESLIDAGSPQAAAWTERAVRERGECQQRARQCGCKSCKKFIPKTVPTSSPEHVASLRMQRAFDASLAELEQRLGMGQSFELCRPLHDKVQRDRSEAEASAARCAWLGCGSCRAFVPRRIPAIPAPATPAIDRSLSAGSAYVVRQVEERNPGIPRSALSDIALFLLGVSIATKNGALSEVQKSFIKDLILMGQVVQLAHADFLLQLGRENQYPARPFFPRIVAPLPSTTEVDEWLGAENLTDLMDTLWRCGVTSLSYVLSLRTHTSTRRRVQEALVNTAWGRSAWERLDGCLQMLSMEDVHRIRLICIARRLECYER